MEIMVGLSEEMLGDDFAEVDVKASMNKYRDAVYYELHSAYPDAIVEVAQVPNGKTYTLADGQSEHPEAERVDFLCECVWNDVDLVVPLRDDSDSDSEYVAAVFACPCCGVHYDPSEE